VLLTVLLLVSLVVTTAATWAHHTSVDFRQSNASLWIEESRNAAQSGLAVGTRLVATGQASYAGDVDAGTQSADVTIADLGGGQRRIRVEATVQGLGTTLDARATVYGTTAGALPRMEATAAAQAKSDPAQTKLTGTKTLQDAVVAGTLVLARGSDVTLQDVVVYGSIVSEPAINGPPYKANEATRLTVTGSLRVDGGTLLPGCAIVMPDGALTVQAGAAVEIHGVVVADRIAWAGQGSADAHIMAAQPFTLPPALDRPRYGRTPPAWPASLQPATFGVSQIAFPPSAPTKPETAAIKGFAFPR
jgi:hypothetical protein